jgi:hypothetical protein
MVRFIRSDVVLSEMKPSIVWASVGMIVYELYALNSHKCEPWTISAQRHSKKSVVIWAYWLWLGIHLITGGRV